MCLWSGLEGHVRPWPQPSVCSGILCPWALLAGNARSSMSNLQQRSSHIEHLRDPSKWGVVTRCPPLPCHAGPRPWWSAAAHRAAQHWQHSFFFSGTRNTIIRSGTMMKQCSLAGRPKAMVQLLLSIDRREDAAAAVETVELAAALRPRGVVGVDLSGNPAAGKWATWLPALQRARTLGLGLTLHAAEVRQPRQALHHKPFLTAFCLYETLLLLLWCCSALFAHLGCVHRSSYTASVETARLCATRTVVVRDSKISGGA